MVSILREIYPGVTELKRICYGEVKGENNVNLVYVIKVGS